MNGRDISIIASTHSHTKHMFGGVYSCDTIPICARFYPVFYIVNTDFIWNKGEHWIFIYITSPLTPMEWFDPLGYLPSHYNSKLHDFVSRRGTSPFFANTAAVQTQTSSSCGQFCLTMADMRGRGLSFDRCMRWFKLRDRSTNDKVVNTYVNQHMKSY